MALMLIMLLLGCISVQETEGPINQAIEKKNETVIEATKEIQIEATRNEMQVLNSNTVFPEPEVFEFNKTINDSYVVYFFHSPKCSACQESYSIISELKDKYPEIIFINYSLATGSGNRAYIQFAELNNLSRDKRLVPQVYVNGSIITNRYNIGEKLGPLLSELK
ncbi:hypothetical protein JXA56_03520 [Candidatus Micrarchaeota archaeon]|nr:hypothetical protein [Candidatus Micrarchaeota archaeon]